MFHIQGLPDNSVYTTELTNVGMWTIFIRCYSLSTCFKPFAIIVRVVYRITRSPNRLLKCVR